MVTTQGSYVPTEQEARRAPLRVSTLRNSRLRALRWWAAALAAAYSTPLALWAIGPDRAPSLSKDMDPVFVAVIVVAAVVVILALHVIRARSVEPRASAGEAKRLLGTPSIC